MTLWCSPEDLREAFLALRAAGAEGDVEDWLGQSGPEGIGDGLGDAVQFARIHRPRQPEERAAVAGQPPLDHGGPAIQEGGGRPGKALRHQATW